MKRQHNDALIRLLVPESPGTVPLCEMLQRIAEQAGTCLILPMDTQMELVEANHA